MECLLELYIRYQDNMQWPNEVAPILVGSVLRPSLQSDGIGRRDPCATNGGYPRSGPTSAYSTAGDGDRASTAETGFHLSDRGADILIPELAGFGLCLAIG